jgi:hypothetical protein
MRIRVGPASRVDILRPPIFFHWGSLPRTLLNECMVLAEGKSQQAIDRLRLVHAATPKTVYLLSNIVLGIDVDNLVTWTRLRNGGS